MEENNEENSLTDKQETISENQETKENEGDIRKPDTEIDQESEYESTNSTPVINIEETYQKTLSVRSIIAISILIVIFLTSIFTNILQLTTNKTAQIEIESIYWFIIIGTFSITTLSIGTSFWLYYVRSIYLINGPALVPEKWGSVIDKISKSNNLLAINTTNSTKSIIDASVYQIEKSEALLESFLTLQTVISNRDEEIKRLKKGHDAKIFKRFIVRFIKVSIALEEIFENEKNSDQEKNYKYLCRLIKAALEECGVEIEIPTEGSDFREYGAEIDDETGITETEDETLDYSISSVQSPCYYIPGEGDRELLIPAKVTIYRLNTKTEEYDNGTLHRD